MAEKIQQHYRKYLLQGLIAGVFIKKKGKNSNLSLDIDLCDRIVEKSMHKGVFIIRTGRRLKIWPTSYN